MVNGTRACIEVSESFRTQLLEDIRKAESEKLCQLNHIFKT